jgi:hypothetical protein
MRRSPPALPSFGISLVRGVCVLLPAGPSRRYSANLSSDAWSPCHDGPTDCLCLVLRLCHRPSPGPQRIGFPLLLAKQLFRGRLFEGCRHSITFKPPSLLVSQVVPTAVHTATRQPRLLGPARTRFVTSALDMLTARIQAIDGTGTFTPQDSHLCRLLHGPMTR